MLWFHEAVQVHHLCKISEFSTTFWKIRGHPNVSPIVLKPLLSRRSFSKVIIFSKIARLFKKRHFWLTRLLLRDRKRSNLEPPKKRKKEDSRLINQHSWPFYKVIINSNAVGLLKEYVKTGHGSLPTAWSLIVKRISSSWVYYRLFR